MVTRVERFSEVDAGAKGPTALHAILDGTDDPAPKARARVASQKDKVRSSPYKLASFVIQQTSNQGVPVAVQCCLPFGRRAIPKMERSISLGTGSFLATQGTASFITYAVSHHTELLSQPLWDIRTSPVLRVISLWNASGQSADVRLTILVKAHRLTLS